MSFTDAAAYALREEGCSPNEIREAAWYLCRDSLSGVLLDAGTGNGEWLKQLLPHVDRAISCDLLPISIPGVESHLVDLSKNLLPVSNASVDVITALEVIEHLANPRHFVAEAHRALKPGGSLFLSTPNNDCLTSRLSLFVRGYYPAFADHSYNAVGHITPITHLDLRRAATEVGFSNIAFHYPLNGRMPKLGLHWQRFFPFLKGRTWSDVLFAHLTK